MQCLVLAELVGSQSAVNEAILGRRQFERLAMLTGAQSAASGRPRRLKQSMELD